MSLNTSRGTKNRKKFGSVVLEYSNLIHDVAVTSSIITFPAILTT
jgi:hypothetical protein